jgi:hypothetical protein
MIEQSVWDVVRSRVAGYCLSGLRIIPSRHPADSSLLGAIAVVLMRFFTTFDPYHEASPMHPVVMDAQRAG